ncbi:MAG: hypothetical protein WKH64_11455 [Chloroflexia bacterium]
MPKLFDAGYSPDELRRLTSDPAQLVGVRLYELSDGRARGVRLPGSTPAAGSASRCCWTARWTWLRRALGPAARLAAPRLGGPDLYDPYGYGWPRTFGGGLVTTCGLTFLASPSRTAPSSSASTGAFPTPRREGSRDDRAARRRVRAGGRGRGQAGRALRGEPVADPPHLHPARGGLSPHRGRAQRGFRPTPHMILYHCNLGFPVVAPAPSCWWTTSGCGPATQRRRQAEREHARVRAAGRRVRRAGVLPQAQTGPTGLSARRS